MNRPNPLVKDDLPNDHKINNVPAFATLYDQYAAVLLGIITKILRNEADSIDALQETFTKVQARMGEFQPEKQPLFVWLLKITRCTALDALKKRKLLEPSTFRLTSSGRVISASQKGLTPISSNSFESKEFLDTVLFKNCTPEEAAFSLNMPIEVARQQLRLAVQQLRTSQQA